MENYKKRSLLFVYPHMKIGGSTTSLLSILSLIDYDKFSVNLLLGEHTGELLNKIPNEVVLLPAALPDKNILKLKKISSLKYIIQAIYARKYKNNNVKSQLMCQENARLSRRISEKYDVAIAFLETYSCDYVSKYISADNKIGWIHLDYKGAGFVPDYDRKCYANLNNIVFVSNECKVNFDNIFPEYSNKTIEIDNILSADHVKKLSRESISFSVDKDYINMVSVCRIDFKHKGLDRGINALMSLEKSLISKIRWYIIGDGPDSGLLQEMISKNNLNECVILLGKKNNPAPYVKLMDIFFLPSRYEGKPMAVTEAMMLGIPAMVSEYASAKEQIKHGYNGIIMENNQEGIANGLEYLLSSPNIIGKMKAHLEKCDYTNIKEMDKIYDLLR